MHFCQVNFGMPSEVVQKTCSTCFVGCKNTTAFFNPSLLICSLQLLDMKWKLSVGVSSSACRSLNSPYITALVTVTDPSGRLLTKSFEMTIGEFKVRHQASG